MRLKTIPTLGVICLFACAAAAQSFSGHLAASIEQAIAGSYQTITFTYEVGDENISPGGGIRLEYPVAYAETEFLFWSKPQTLEPDLLGYVSGKTSTGAAVAVVAYGIAGGIFQCTLKEGELKKGDKLFVEYKGLVQSLAGNFTVRAQMRTGQREAWQDVTAPPHIEIVPHPGKTMMLTSPSDLSIGQPFSLAVVVLDKFGNLATSFRGTVQFQSTDTAAELPPTYTFTDKDQGKHVFENVTYHSPGFQKIRVENTQGLELSTHYSYLSATESQHKRYFGDTHFHTGTGTRNKGFFGNEPTGADGANADVNTLSLADFQQFNAGGDHRGNFTTAPEAYTYAKEVLRLDFASSSEHDVTLFDADAWELSQRITDSFDEPGRFTTFYAYEWTPGITHHIILYKDRGLTVFDQRACPNLPALWAAFDKQGKPAICIPHLTWDFAEHTNWDHINNTYRRLGEIYSLWNGRYLVQPGDEPQRFELGKDNRWSFQHAWHNGHRIGVIGSTDNHLGRPGANNYTIYTQHTGGFAVAVSGANTRESLWDALESRRTYATTGTRIYVDFQVNGQPMGSEIKSQTKPVITGKVGGTNKLATVEVVKYAHGEYTTIYQASPDAETLEFSLEDKDFDADCFYYLRVFQVSEVPGRLWTFPTNEMAWSSPVWVELEE